jgi:CsoR family transcriptional regulator, copper-sensing transcriptional repressor
MDESKMDSKEDILKRLRRIEGQVRGIHRMIEEDQNCTDILTQVAAVRAAINRAGGLILQKHSMACIQKAASAEDKNLAFSELARTMQSFMKFMD